MAEFPVKEQSVVVSVPATLPAIETAPPLTNAVLPDNTQLVRDNASSMSRIAPPEPELLPPLSVRSRTVTAVPAAADDVLKIRLAPLPEIVNKLGLGPSMMTAPLMAISPVVSV